MDIYETTSLIFI